MSAQKRRPLTLQIQVWPKAPRRSDPSLNAAPDDNFLSVNFLICSQKRRRRQAAEATIPLTAMGCRSRRPAYQADTNFKIKSNSQSSNPKAKTDGVLSI